MRHLIFVVFISVVFVGTAISKSRLSALPKPEVNENSWVMVEIWPEVNDITLSAYFLDSSEQKNKALCASVKTVFDRDQDAKERKLKKKFTSYRRCLSVNKAMEEGLIVAKE